MRKSRSYIVIDTESRAVFDQQQDLLRTVQYVAPLLDVLRPSGHLSHGGFPVGLKVVQHSPAREREEDEV